MNPLNKNNTLKSNDMRKTAIVIDDDPDSVEIFSLLLEEQNIAVVGEGYNGRDAIRLYQEKQPDFVFLDLKMPEGSGFHAIRSIKKINDLAKIVVVTAHSDYSITKKLTDLGIHGVITKPFEMNKIINLVS